MLGLEADAEDEVAYGLCDVRGTVVSELPVLLEVRVWPAKDAVMVVGAPSAGPAVIVTGRMVISPLPRVLVPSSATSPVHTPVVVPRMEQIT